MTRLEEVSIKVLRLQELMQAKGLKGILLKKQPNFSWLTAGGYNMVGIASEMGVTSLLVTANERYIIANRIEMRRMLVEEGLESLGFKPLEFEWFEDREAELVKNCTGELSGVGCDVGFADTRNMDGEIKKLRYSLTDSEVERYLFLGEKLSAAIEKVALGVKPGDRECEIAGRIGTELWKDRIDPTGIMVAADERVYAYRHPIPTTKMVKRYVMLCCNARYKGLITTITRIVHFGRPMPALEKQFGCNMDIENRMIAATKPGTSVSVPFEKCLSAYREFGYPEEWKLHHQGGAMGYYARDIKVTEESKDIVQPKQAFCWNPSISGTKTEDGFIATADGPVMISSPVVFPRIESITDGVRLVRPGMLVVD
jgi:Xaa-Pro aminopeptidase